MLSISWDINGSHGGLIFLDKLVERSPDAMLIFSGKEACHLGTDSIRFLDSVHENLDDSDDMGFGLFDEDRPIIFDSYFPFTGLVEEKPGFVCLNFAASEKEIQENQFS